MQDVLSRIQKMVRNLSVAGIAERYWSDADTLATTYLKVAQPMTGLDPEAFDLEYGGASPARSVMSVEYAIGESGFAADIEALLETLMALAPADRKRALTRIHAGLQADLPQLLEIAAAVRAYEQANPRATEGSSALDPSATLQALALLLT